MIIYFKLIHIIKFLHSVFSQNRKEVVSSLSRIEAESLLNRTEAASSLNRLECVSLLRMEALSKTEFFPESKRS